MKILVINCGSSSIKYKLYQDCGTRLLTKGSIEKIGEPRSGTADHRQGIEKLLADILKTGILKNLGEIAAVGHRVVHGGETFTRPHIINAHVLKKIRQCSRLAPLHNPANLAGILGCKKLLASATQVAIFDTAFHQSIPDYAYTYPIPKQYYVRYGVRKYGFHGTSHQFIAQEASRALKKPPKQLKLITCHLGNGCSITAIDKGKSVDTSMGFTPLEGLMMGTRSGDIDVAAVFYIMNRENITIKEMDSILNKRSGFLGVSGLSNDFRAITKARRAGNKTAALAYAIFVYRLKKYIGAYYFILGGADAVCFTGGIGEHAPDMVGAVKRDIQATFGKKVKVLTIPTDEELLIARLTYSLVQKKRKVRGD